MSSTVTWTLSFKSIHLIEKKEKCDTFTTYGQIQQTTNWLNTFYFSKKKKKKKKIGFDISCPFSRKIKKIF